MPGVGRLRKALTQSTVYGGKNVEAYIVSIISAFLGYVSSRFANRKSKGILPTIGILSVLAFIAAGLTFLGHWGVKPPQPAPDRLEGQWIERYKEGGEDTYAIATIRYNPEARYLEFSGNAYASKDSNLSFVGQWQTIQARLTSSQAGSQYDYLFEGYSKNLDILRQGHRKGVGGIWFDSPNHGVGSFFSISPPADKELREFQLYKILDEDAATQSKNDSPGLVRKLYKEQGYFEKVTSAH